MNQFGLELQRQIAGPNANVCLSPYSIETAFAMTYAGSAGRTRREMASVFHFPTNESELHEGLATLQRMLDEAVQRGEPRINTLPTGWNPGDPLTLSVANRLFGRNGVRIQAPFLSLTRDRYGAPLETLDFLHHTEASRLQINAWVAEQTRQKILDLIPSGNLPANTELVLVNALYFRAQWANPFQSGETHPEPFRRPGLDPIPVPMMTQENQFGYVHRDGYTMLTLPYSGRELQLVVLLPDSPTGLPDLERRLQATNLAACIELPVRKLRLHMPKFRLQPPSLPLKKSLKALGLQSAFGDSADFSRMFEEARPGDFKISEAFHKTFIDLDERGTEAAAATGVIMVPSKADPPARPIEVRIDHPFLFAVQHVPSSACLFLGRLTDPH